jgi:hypothetical protein
MYRQQLFQGRQCPPGKMLRQETSALRKAASRNCNPRFDEEGAKQSSVCRESVNIPWPMKAEGAAFY